MNLSDATVMSVIGAILASLSAVIKILWDKIEQSARSSEQGRIDCENDRKSLWNELRQLAEKTGLCTADPCPLKQKK